MSNPTRSVVLKIAVLGRPRAGPNSASTSGIVNPSSTMACMIFPIPCTPILFPTKFGVSFAQTIPLPRYFSPNMAINSRISGSVFSPGMSSSRCMYLTGLKKWVPMKCSLKLSLKPFEISLSGIPEVFELIMESGFLTVSILLKSSRFISRRSTTTSMIQSQVPSLSKSSSRLPVSISAASFFVIKREGLEASAASRPAFTILFLAAGLFFSSSFKSNGTMSKSSTLTPAPASRAAIPPPMIPDPITAAFLIFFVITTSCIKYSANNNYE